METVKDSTFIEALLPLIVIVFIIAVGVVLLYQHFQKNLFLQKLKQETMKNIYQNDLLRTNIQAQEAERKRIAQDLHDELGATLSIIRMNIMILEQKQNDDPENLAAGLRNVRLLSETALASVRHISHRLMPPQLEAFGLVNTLESVVEQINGTGKLQVELSAPEQWHDVTWDVNIGLYRIIMELINNTIKHADASLAKIDISHTGESIVCKYEDNGKGLEKNNTKGLGHAGIHARINTLKGKFDFGNRAGGGFHATIEIPVKETGVS